MKRASGGAVVDPLQSWPAFMDAVKDRMAMGANAYRDRPAATRPLPELLDELKAEVEDIAGWACCLWCRLEAMRASVEALGDTSARAPDDTQPRPRRMTGPGRAAR